MRVMTVAGLVRRMVKGVYVAAQVPDSIVLRGQALSLVVPSYAVVTDWTACWFHTGYDRPGSHLVEPELVALPRGGPRPVAERAVQQRSAHAHARRCLAGRRTCRDLSAPDGLGPGSARAARSSDRCDRRPASAAGRSPTTSLLEGVDRFKGMRGVVQLRWLAPLADARSESPASRRCGFAG